MSKSVVILTGCELRHRFVRKAMALDPGINVLRSYCEGTTGTIVDLVSGLPPDGSALQRAHLEARLHSEDDFFGAFDSLVEDRSNPTAIERGSINSESCVQEILELKPDLLAAYGCSIIRKPLLRGFSGRFLNVHLGISPYYRGSGTNFWPLVNGEPEFVGATFMHMDSGVDTGKIIHQIRAKIFPGDTPHQIGNRLISNIPRIYSAIIRNFDRLQAMAQPVVPNCERVYRQRDFTEDAVRRLYERFDAGMIQKYLERRLEREAAVPLVINPVIETDLAQS
jgi:folate-dependent phosphoribosylglycinamide formyltransferase PurN